MRLGIISDIHKDYNELNTDEDITSLYIAELKKRDLDVVIIAGDIAEDLLEVKEFVNELQSELGIPILSVPGNHEMWEGEGVKKQSTEMRYMDFATQIEGSLCGKPYHLNDEWVVVGNMGWYDYGFRPHYITEEIVAQKKKKVWKHEYKAINLQISDQQFAKQMVEQVEKEIKQLQDKKILFINHFVLFPQFLTFKEKSDDWNFANAFMGSKSMGEMVLRYPNIKLAVFGHTHKRFGICDYNEHLKVVCNPLGYCFEWAVKNVSKQIERSIVEIELDELE